MSTEQMRNALKNVSKYAKSSSWQNKVDKMSDDQVTAIYIAFQRRGLIRSY